MFTISNNVDRLKIITEAFPSSLRTHSQALAEATPVMIVGESANTYSINLAGEVINVPVRIYSAEATLESRVANDVQVTMLRCLYSRHHNGYVREKALRELIASPRSFVVPYVVQLASEYVEEILIIIRDHLPTLDRRVYGSFLLENPRYEQTVRSRIISYWHAYYRQRDRDYVGFDILDFFDAAVADARGTLVGRSGDQVS